MWHYNPCSGATVYTPISSRWRWSYGGFMVEEWWKYVKRGWSQGRIYSVEIRQAGGRRGYAQMVTQFHTLLHFVTLICTISSPTACVAASIRIQGVSKSHLLSIFHCIRTHTQSPAAGPTHYKGLYQHCIRYWSSVHPHMREPFTHYPSTACDDHHPIVL